METRPSGRLNPIRAIPQPSFSMIMVSGFRTTGKGHQPYKSSVLMWSSKSSHEWVET